MFVVIVAAGIANLSMTAIPCLTFYGDSVRGRANFFADRGISPTLVWLTRVSVTAFFALIVIVGCAIAVGGDAYFLVPVMISGYALCVLVSQWVSRAALVFFAAPAVLTFCALPLAMLLEQHAAWTPILLVSAAFLLFASWRLTADWMSRSKGQRYGWRYARACVVAVAIPFVLVVGTRLATMPSVDEAFRARLAATDFKSEATPEVVIMPKARRTPRTKTRLEPSTFMVGNLAWLTDFLEGLEESGVVGRCEREIEAVDTVGEHIGFSELIDTHPTMIPVGGYRAVCIANLSMDGTEMPEEEIDKYERLSLASAHRLARVLVKWSSVVRSQAAVGRVGFDTLNRCAEEADGITIRLLAGLVREYGMTPEVRSIYDQFPDDDLIVRSRSSALVRDWRRDGLTCFGLTVAVPSAQWMSHEFTRTQRIAERTMESAIKAWENGNNSPFDKQFVSDVVEAGLETSPVERIRGFDAQRKNLRSQIRAAELERTAE